MGMFEPIKDRKRAFLNYPGKDEAAKIREDEARVMEEDARMDSLKKGNNALLIRGTGEEEKLVPMPMKRPVPESAAVTSEWSGLAQKRELESSTLAGENLEEGMN